MQRFGALDVSIAMSAPRSAAVAGAALLITVALAACGESKPQPDPAVLDNHFNKIIAEDEAERERLVEEARDREEAREREMEQREENYGNAAD